MREILFRGKRKDNGEWVQGYYTKGFRNENDAELSDFIYMFSGESGKWEFDYAVVIPETVGQFTGLTDKNGKKIFEGDIVRFADEVYSIQRECDTPGGYWAETGFILSHIGWNDYTHFTDTIDDYENECQVFVAGNIHDNPELLKGAYNA